MYMYMHIDIVRNFDINRAKTGAKPASLDCLKSQDSAEGPLLKWSFFLLPKKSQVLI